MDRFFPYHPAWSTADASLVEQIKANVDWIALGDATKVMSQKLPFYPDSTFIMVKDSIWNPRNVFVYLLCQDGEFKFLNGTSPPIHEFNNQGNLKLNDDNVVDYLTFFTFFVRGEEGPFYIPRSPDSPYLPTTLRRDEEVKEDKVADTVARFADIFQSPRVFEQGDESVWFVSAIVHYSNAVFNSDFEIQRGGMVEMKRDTPVMADLPAKIDAPLIPA